MTDYSEVDVYEQQGLGVALSWRMDKPNPSFSDAYNRFIENGYIGILSKAEAVECYKRQTGRNPEFVTEWPEIDAIAEAREAMAADTGAPESFLNEMLPYEPALKFQY